mmetsp:Transcript_6910/g.9939  ORF Transcript_6910/g.9939 Transcript_6910/m.9939 type:complete len:149 (+) Transcript_6910:41-487(+)
MSNQVLCNFLHFNLPRRLPASLMPMNDYLMPRQVTTDTRTAIIGEEETTKVIALDSAALINKVADLEEEEAVAEATKEEVVEAVAAEEEVEDEEAVDAAAVALPRHVITTTTRVIGGNYYLKKVRRVSFECFISVQYHSSFCHDVDDV